MSTRGSYGFKLLNGQSVMTHHQMDMQPEVHGKALAAEAIHNRGSVRELNNLALSTDSCPPLDDIQCPDGCPCDHPQCPPRWCYVKGSRFNIAGHFDSDGFPNDQSVLDCPVFHLMFHKVGAPRADHLGWEDVRLETFEQPNGEYPRPSFVELAERPEVAPPVGDYEYAYVWDLISNTLHTYEGDRLQNSNSLAHPSTLSALARWAGVEDFL